MEIVQIAPAEELTTGLFADVTEEPVWKIQKWYFDGTSRRNGCAAVVRYQHSDLHKLLERACRKL